MPEKTTPPKSRQARQPHNKILHATLILAEPKNYDLPERLRNKDIAD